MHRRSLLATALVLPLALCAGSARLLLPELAPALIAGAALAFARGLGEFGAVFLIAGNLPFVRGQTNTLPLQIELLHNDYNATGAFGAAAILTLIALVTVVLKAWLEGQREV